MSMTESEAIEYLLNHYLVVGSPVNPPKEECEKHNAVMDMAIAALSKIQEYRTLEEKLNGITVREVVEHFIKTVENQTEEDYTKVRILTNKEAEEWERFHAIGTVSEFRELKEKATAKKVVVKGVMGFEGEESYCCPNCGLDISQWGYGVCIDCGQKLLY